MLLLFQVSVDTQQVVLLLSNNAGTIAVKVTHLPCYLEFLHYTGMGFVLNNSIGNSIPCNKMTTSNYEPVIVTNEAKGPT